jgi:urease accessory protein
LSIRLIYRLAAAGVLLVATNMSASAHHLMGGKMPGTFAEGLLSGLGHPVIGIDHLVIITAIGLAVGAGGLSLATPAVFVICSAIGVALHVNAVTVPGSEALVALSVIVAGLLLALGRTLAPPKWTLLFAAAGVLHGYAYGESIFGAEPTPLWAYLIGLVIIQTALTIAIALAARRIKLHPAALNARLVGATLAGIGIALLAGQHVPAA